MVAPLTYDQIFAVLPDQTQISPPAVGTAMSFLSLDGITYLGHNTSTVQNQNAATATFHITTFSYSLLALQIEFWLWFSAGMYLQYDMNGVYNINYFI